MGIGDQYHPMSCKSENDFVPYQTILETLCRVFAISWKGWIKLCVSTSAKPSAPWSWPIIWLKKTLDTCSTQTVTSSQGNCRGGLYLPLTILGPRARGSALSQRRLSPWIRFPWKLLHTTATRPGNYFNVFWGITNGIDRFIARNFPRSFLWYSKWPILCRVGR